jgi:hypothetical protein
MPRNKFCWLHIYCYIRPYNISICSLFAHFFALYKFQKCEQICVSSGNLSSKRELLTFKKNRRFCAGILDSTKVSKPGLLTFYSFVCVYVCTCACIVCMCVQSVCELLECIIKWSVDISSYRSFGYQWSMILISMKD